MIYPLTLDDVENATDQEVIDAYIREGDSEAGAHAYLAIIRGRIPPGMIVD